MATIYKFAATTKTTKEEIITAEAQKLTAAVVEEKPVEKDEQQITISDYTAFVQRLLPIVKKAKQKGGLVAELLGKRADGSLNIRYSTCNVATIAKEEGVDKSEIQKIWDMV